MVRGGGIRKIKWWNEFVLVVVMFGLERIVKRK